MRRFLPLLAALLALPAAADDLKIAAVGAHVASWHSEDGYNNRNPGLYLRTTGGWAVGAYRNSIRRDSAYAGRAFTAELVLGLRAELLVGGVTGYEAARVVPLVAPSLLVGVPGGALRLTVLPKIDPKQGAHVAHFSVEWEL